MKFTLAVHVGATQENYCSSREHSILRDAPIPLSFYYRVLRDSVEAGAPYLQVKLFCCDDDSLYSRRFTLVCGRRH